MASRQLDRRTVIRLAAAAATVGVAPAALIRTAGALGVSTGAALMAPDPNGWRLLPGYTSRVVATSGQIVSGTGYTWHLAPDGAAVFAGPDGGWTYVSNSERAAPNGGVGMVRFAADGSIVDARSLMTGTDLNCSGGPTPWGSWLSCEETTRGLVWEVDPTGAAAPAARPALGRFVHEGAAVSVGWGAIYLTEDLPDGCLYRFRPSRWTDLSAGELSVLDQGPGGLRWSVIADPSAAATATRFQVPTAVRFNGGEGVAYAEDTVFFTTKGDNRVWELDLETLDLSVLYDAGIDVTTAFRGVDQMTITPWGDVLVVEDQGDMEVTLVTRDGQVTVIGQLPGVTGSELTGPAFDPSGTRLYVTSQRNPGVTYEISGPFPAPVVTPPEEPPVDPPVVVRFEEGAEGIGFSGSWFVWADGSQSGGAAMVGRGVSSRVDVAFSGSVVRWIGQRGPARALGRVSVDGVVVETVDSYAAAYSSRQVLFERSGLGAGAHTLTVEFAGANPAATGWPALVFDAVEAEALGVVVPPVDPPVVVRFEEGAEGIGFSGSWFVWADGSQSGGAAMVGRGVSSRVDVAFSGSVVRWIGQRGPARALGRVSVDGVVVETVDSYAAAYSSRQVLFERSGLGAGAHTLTVEFAGANPAATGWPALVFDAVEAEALDPAI